MHSSGIKNGHYEADYSVGYFKRDYCNSFDICNSERENLINLPIYSNR